MFAAPLAAQSPLQLEIDGQVVAAAGQLEVIEYVPGQSLDVRTFFGDIRCMPATTTGSLNVNLDRVNPELEPEATFGIAADGLIEFDTAANTLRIQTAAGAEMPDCTHFISAVGAIGPGGEADPGTFWASDFGDPLELAATTTSPAFVGDQLVIEFSVTNVTAVLVTTGIDVDFASSFDSTSITGPSFNPEITGTTWNIPILWPGESASITVTYDIGVDATVGTEIETRIDSINALDRAAINPISTGGATISIVNTVATP